MFIFINLIDRKTKRVGTMEKVISDLNRFERLNAQVMAADNKTQY